MHPRSEVLPCSTVVEAASRSQFSRIRRTQFNMICRLWIILVSFYPRNAAPAASTTPRSCASVGSRTRVSGLLVVGSWTCISLFSTDSGDILPMQLGVGGG